MTPANPFGCPGCAQPMMRKSFARKPHGAIELDLCFNCHGIWFDQYESAQLTPGAVMDLFRAIHEHHDQPPRPLGKSMRCPKCRDRLTLTHDVQRTNRISYYRCPRGDGRLTTFFQFLREKNFVRTLTRPEVAQLRVTISQVRCSSCGAPVELGGASACGYCHAPISILDADAVKRNLAELSAAEQKARHYDPTAAIDGLLAGQHAGRRIDEASRRGRGTYRSTGAALADVSSSNLGELVDLVGDALHFLMRD